MAKQSLISIKKQCRQIKRLWAEGVDDTQIKDMFGLSQAQWNIRLKYIASEKYNDKSIILYKYETKMTKRYDQLEALLLSTNSERIKLDCIKEMKEIDEKIIELGQKLGVYQTAPTMLNIESTNMSMGVFKFLDDVPVNFVKEITDVANDRIRKKYLKVKQKSTTEERRKLFGDTEET